MATHPSYKCIRTQHLAKSQNSLFEARGRYSSLLVTEILVETDNNMVILHEVKLVPDALAKGINSRIVRLLLDTLVFNHIPMI